MINDNSLVPAVNKEIIVSSGAIELLSRIRPQWRSKKLIARVNRLLNVDPSSACQRIFNACIHDLREKIIIAGLDIAADSAQQFKLPTVAKPEDIDNYRVSNVITLAYRMGLLTHPEWRRLLRVYDIRRDLEHEDDQYEASIEDCYYIFKTCIEVVLSQDPVHLLKLTDIKEIVEQPIPAILSDTLLNDYQKAPQPRQLEIYRFLISISLDNKHSDIVRQNCFNIIGRISSLTNRQVILDSANEFIERFNRKTPNLIGMRIAFAADILPYLKKSMLKDFFSAYFDRMKKTGYTFRSHTEHGELLRNFIEIGGLDHCPDEIFNNVLEWLILCYVGESSFGPFRYNRRVFYSNIGAPLSLEIIANCKRNVLTISENLGKSSQDIRYYCSDGYVARRFQQVLDELKNKINLSN
jgi:hypothetical protein